MPFTCQPPTRARGANWASILIFAAMPSACGGAHPNDTRDVASVNLACTPIPRGVHCRLLALLLDVSRSPRDITADASWLLRGAAAAQISPGGVITATEDGDIEIDAHYQGHRVQARARLVPNGPGQMLATLRGRVYVEAEGTLRPIAQAHIEVVGGPSAGLSTTTAGDGSYEFAGLMPGDVVIRATKTGCTVADRSTQIHPGENRLSVLIDRAPPTTASAL